MGSKVLNGELIHSEMTARSKGGTELLAVRLLETVPKSLFDTWEIHISRLGTQTPGKRQILWCHDLHNDPAVAHLVNGGWRKFEKIVFVSHWQKQMYEVHLGVPPSAGIVIPNSIYPMTPVVTPGDGLRLIYTSTPQRGLNIVAPVFNKLAEEFDHIHLDVYSSFDLYGWSEKDLPYQQLFDVLTQSPRVTYNKSIPNDLLRDRLQQSHIFVYPSIWPETSCLCLIEAMCAGLTCVHSSLGALPETSLGMTVMYDYTENINDHAYKLYETLRGVILNHERFDNKTVSSIANLKYSSIYQNQRWVGLLST